MADLMYLGTVTRAEYDDADFVESVALGRRLRARQESDRKFQVGLAKLLVQAMGVRLTGG